MRKLTALFVILASSIHLSAWGSKGHRVVADVAEVHLTAEAKAGIAALLGIESLAQISTWADEVRRDRPETYNWHFVDIPSEAKGYDAARDCRPSPRGDCVIAEIERARATLADASKPRQERVEALKWLVHLVADLHQPMHAIAKARGGNDIHVVEFGSAQCSRSACNLHGVWDTALIERTGRSEAEYGDHLEQLIRGNHLTASGTPLDWANESHDLARSAWLMEGGIVDEQYYSRQIPVVDQRLALAGLRLAALLNAAFAQGQHS